MDELDRPDGNVFLCHCLDPGRHDDLGIAFAEHSSAIATTRGDRLFIGLLGSAYLHLLVIGVTDWSIWVASALSLVWLLAVMRWG